MKQVASPEPTGDKSGAPTLPAEPNGSMRLAPAEIYAESSSDAASLASLELPMGEPQASKDRSVGRGWCWLVLVGICWQVSKSKMF